MEIPFAMSWIEIINTVVLAITAAIIAWYTVETYRLRRETVRQNELQLRPYVVPTFSAKRDGYKLELKNIGKGTATNVHLDTLSIDLGGSEEQWRAKFSSVDYIEPGSKTEPGMSSNRLPKFLSTMLVPSDSAVPWTLRVLFDDIEGGRYLLEFDIMPPQIPNSTNVIVRPIRRMPPDYRFEG